LQRRGAPTKRDRVQRRHRGQAPDHSTAKAEDAPGSHVADEIQENADGERRGRSGGERLAGVSAGARDAGCYRDDAEERRDLRVEKATDRQAWPAFLSGR